MKRHSLCATNLDCLRRATKIHGDILYPMQVVQVQGKLTAVKDLLAKDQARCEAWLGPVPFFNSKDEEK